MSHGVRLKHREIPVLCFILIKDLKPSLGIRTLGVLTCDDPRGKAQTEHPLPNFALSHSGSLETDGSCLIVSIFTTCIHFISPCQARTETKKVKYKVVNLVAL